MNKKLIFLTFLFLAFATVTVNANPLLLNLIDTYYPQLTTVYVYVNNQLNPVSVSYPTPHFGERHTSYAWKVPLPYDNYTYYYFTTASPTGLRNFPIAFDARTTDPGRVPALQALYVWIPAPQSNPPGGVTVLTPAPYTASMPYTRYPFVLYVRQIGNQIQVYRFALDNSTATATFSLTSLIHLVYPGTCTFSSPYYSLRSIFGFFVIYAYSNASLVDRIHDAFQLIGKASYVFIDTTNNSTWTVRISLDNSTWIDVSNRKALILSYNQTYTLYTRYSIGIVDYQYGSFNVQPGSVFLLTANATARIEPVTFVLPQAVRTATLRIYTIPETVAIRAYAGETVFEGTGSVVVTGPIGMPVTVEFWYGGRRLDTQRLNIFDTEVLFMFYISPEQQAKYSVAVSVLDQRAQPLTADKICLNTYCVSNKQYYTFENVAWGTNTVRVEKTGYEPFTGTIFVNSSGTVYVFMTPTGSGLKPGVSTTTDIVPIYNASSMNVVEGPRQVEGNFFGFKFVNTGETSVSVTIYAGKATFGKSTKTVVYQGTVPGGSIRYVTLTEEEVTAALRYAPWEWGTCFDIYADGKAVLVDVSMDVFKNKYVEVVVSSAGSWAAGTPGTLFASQSQGFDWTAIIALLPVLIVLILIIKLLDVL